MIAWVILAGILFALLVVVIFTGRAKRGSTDGRVLLTVLEGEAAMKLTADQLVASGIRPRVRAVANVSSGYGGAPPAVYRYEIWVAAKDEKRARAILGL